MHALLATLHDVPGVVGSFVVDAEGTLCGRNLPAFFDDSALQDTGPRLVRMCRALGAPASTPGECTLRFGRQLLYIHAFVEGLLCVVAPVDVNRPALGMGCSLVVQQLGPLLEAGTGAHPSPAPQNPRAAPRPATPPSPPGSSRYYRGRRVD